MNVDGWRAGCVYRVVGNHVPETPSVHANGRRAGALEEIADQRAVAQCRGVKVRTHITNVVDVTFHNANKADRGVSLHTNAIVRKLQTKMKKFIVFTCVYIVYFQRIKSQV